MIQPIYVRLQTYEKGSVILREAIPQSFQDHIGTIDLSVLALFISSNAQEDINLSRDSAGNLWVAINCTFDEDDYISTLIWVSSETTSENMTIPDSVPFPQNYPEEVEPFLAPGIRMPVNNDTIKAIAMSNKTDNMVETVRNVLNFVTESQEYDREKIKLLINGNLTTTNILKSLKYPLETLETGSSFCFERSLYASTILRAAGVPARTFTDAGLKTWTQVWLPGCGWVDADCLPSPDFPRSIASSIPWMVENSSDAIFPITWSPETLMRVANLTFSAVEAFNVNEYDTILSEPINADVFAGSPEDYSFPILYGSEIVYAAVTRNGSDLAFSLIKGKEEVSETLVLNKTNTITLGDVAVSFKPVLSEDFVVLHDFNVQMIWRPDLIILIPVVGVLIILVSLFYWKKRKR